MPMPNYKEIMKAFLNICNDNQEHSLQDINTRIPEIFQLSEEEKMETLGCRKNKIKHRIGAARTELKKQGLIESPRIGVFKITESGRENINNPNAEDPITFPENDIDAIERIDVAFEELYRNLKNELIEKVKLSSPSFFEQLVIDLLLEMGYGGSRKDAGQVIGGPGDGGIDGLINEDRLGLDVIYVQAKKWENSVGRPDIQRFAGALQQQRAVKGIFITTSSFTREAKQYALDIQNKIVLIDGLTLAELMLEHNVGISIKSTYHIKEIDTDFFVE